MKIFRNRGLIRIISICLLAGMIVTDHARADLPSAQEAPLNPNGGSYEINPDAAGKLWVSDLQAGEIWGIDPATGDYQVYPVGGQPTDAHQMGGWLWWADNSSNLIGRVSTDGSGFTEWQITGDGSFSGGFYSTYLDEQGRFYAAAANNEPYLFQLDTTQSPYNLCDFSLPTGLSLYWQNSYMVGADGYLWVVDSEGKLLRILLSENTATLWVLSADGLDRTPAGVTLDNQGNLWYADFTNKVLARLDPVTSHLTSFAIPAIPLPPPATSSPTMISAQSDLIWYTDDLPGFGRLDPLTASSTTITLTPEEQLLTPECSVINSYKTGTLQLTPGQLSWTPATYPALVNNAGWDIFQLPAGDSPWGITVGEMGYVIDSARNVISEFSSNLPVQRRFYLPITIK